MDSLHRRTIKWGFFIVLLVLAYGYGVLIMCERQIPYERPPKATAAEELKIESVKRGARLGNVTRVDCVEGVYFDLGNGKKRWAVRR